MSNPTLSVSSYKLLLSCEQRYWHYKVANTPKDSDFEEGDFLSLGKAFHQVLEKTLHNSWNERLLAEAMTEHDADPADKELLEIMLDKYVQYHKKSGLKVVKCELGITTSTQNLFIDFIAISYDSKGNAIGWWIGDLKTSSKHDENILGQLARDPQMNYYAGFADDVHIAVPEVEGLPFLGCRYRQIIKSKAKTRKGLEAGVKVYDIEIPAEALDTEGFKSQFNTIYDRALAMHNGEAPVKNFSSCFNYFSPCPYFSKCHGSLFSEGKSKVSVHTIESLEEGELL